MFLAFVNICQSHIFELQLKNEYESDLRSNTTQIYDFHIYSQRVSHCLILFFSER